MHTQHSGSDTALAAACQHQEHQQAWGTEVGGFLLDKDDEGPSAEPLPRPQSTPTVTTPHNTTDSTANNREPVLHTAFAGAPLPAIHQQQQLQEPVQAHPAPAPLTAGRSTQPGQQSSPLFLLQKEAERHQHSMSSGAASSPALAAGAPNLPQQRGHAAPFSQPSLPASSGPLGAVSPFSPPSLLSEGADTSVSSSLYVKNLPPGESGAWACVSPPCP